MISPREEELDQVRRDLGLDEIPKPRYDDLPQDSSDGVSVALLKAVACVDSLATAAFSKYIPDDLEIDQGMDARVFRRGWTWGVAIPTDVPVPTNRKISLSLKIPANCRDESAFFPAIAARMWQVAEELGTRRMAPPLVFRCDGEPGVSRPCIGLVLKFDRTPPSGRREEDLMRDLGLLVPPKIS